MPQTSLSALEYEEEDLFGSETEATEPLYAAITRPESSSTKGKARQISPPIAKYSINGRMEEIRNKKRSMRSISAPSHGVPTLKSYCHSVVKRSAGAIFNVGDMEYGIIRDFINDIPREQLEEIEQASPHLKKDTDWLWEYFILDLYPLFHERCRLKSGGEVRESGWRRMFRKAAQEDADRKEAAVARAILKYKQLDQERDAKKIVQIDKTMAVGKNAMSRGRGSGSRTASSVRSVSSTSSSSSMIAKAKNEAHRYKIAFTHASGKYDPLSASAAAKRVTSRPTPQTDTFRMSYSTPSTSSSPQQRPAQRYPPISRAPRVPSSNPQRRDRSLSSSPIPLPGSHPTDLKEKAKYQASLPKHLAARPETAPNHGPAVGERFKISENRLREIRKPQTENFVAPRKQAEAFDYFGGNAKAEKRPRSDLEVLSSPDKRRKTSTSDVSTTSSSFVPRKPVAILSPTLSLIPSPALPPYPRSGRIHSGQPVADNALLAGEMSGIFRTRKKARPKA